MNAQYHLRICVTIVWALGFAFPAFAQRDLKDIPLPDPELERKTFEVAEGFEVNLFAADPLLAKPIHMNFDSRGRLWIASSEVYPQIAPGQQATDKILVLEDANGDGTAEKTTVFADGLLIPTGVEPGDGGAYVANSTELVHLADTDGDGRADRRRIVLSGFGTEDTHHILHTLRWGHDGLLYMNQSIYIHSHIETPHGVRRMNGGGIWHFRPETMQLETFMLGLVNTWGHHFDRFGQSFATDGAGGEGINHIFPGWVGIASPGAKRVLHGLNPGSPKYCGLETVSGRHFPDDWQGNLVTNDFRAHRVCRFVLSEDGSGYAARLEKDVIKSSHVAFRPIDVKMGPDGALYIADWYNPIIQHGEVDFRDPRRDHVHGRIWRVSAKGREFVARPKLPDMSVDQLLAELYSPEQWTRHHAKRVLKERSTKEVLPKLDEVTAAQLAVQTQTAPNETDPREREPFLLELLWTYQSLDRVQPELLAALLRSDDHRIRAAATRVIYHWHERLADPLALLAERVADPHPRVRLEAVRSLGRLSDPKACEVAMLALDQAMDANLDFALWTTARDLGPRWLPALKEGRVQFGGDVKHLTFALSAVESPNVVPLLLEQVSAGKLDSAQEAGLLATISALADANQLETLFSVALDGKQSDLRRAQVLAALVEAAERRKVQPAGDGARIGILFDADDPRLLAVAIDVAGAWKVEALRDPIEKVASDTKAELLPRRAAMLALARLGGEQSQLALELLADGDRAGTPTQAAIAALARVDLASAAEKAAALLTELPAKTDPAIAVGAFLSQSGGPAALTAAIRDQKLSPDAAKLAVRAVRSAGRDEPELLEALLAAGGIQAGLKAYTPAELEAFLTDVRGKGDPARGETIFRRVSLGCQKCHAIGGAGGAVGPDLASIGAGAQPDYLVESLLDPGKKIKENYHSLVVLTDDGQVVTGVKLRQTDSELLLRTADDRELHLPLDAIEDQKDGGSLMPAGLSDELTRDELVDLVRFLTELGKGDYAIGKQRYVRRWEVATEIPPTGEKDGSPSVQLAKANWVPLYSRVAGDLHLEELESVTIKDNLKLSFIRFYIDVTTPGKTLLKLGASERLALVTVDRQRQVLANALTLDLARGRHAVELTIYRDVQRQPLQVELVDVPGSPAQVQPVMGK